MRSLLQPNYFSNKITQKRRYETLTRDFIGTFSPEQTATASAKILPLDRAHHSARVVDPKIIKNDHSEILCGTSYELFFTFYILIGWTDFSSNYFLIPSIVSFSNKTKNKFFRISHQFSKSIISKMFSEYLSIRAFEMIYLWGTKIFSYWYRTVDINELINFGILWMHLL